MSSSVSSSVLMMVVYRVSELWFSSDLGSEAGSRNRGNLLLIYFLVFEENENSRKVFVDTG